MCMIDVYAINSFISKILLSFPHNKYTPEIIEDFNLFQKIHLDPKIKRIKKAKFLENKMFISDT